MSGLAKVSRSLGADGHRLGSRRRLALRGDRLRAAGITPAVGHDAANVPAGAEVVYSSAIPPDNPERTTGAPELHRADLLAELTRLKPTIAVSGTHGKTTTIACSSTRCAAGADRATWSGGEVRSHRHERRLGRRRVADRRGRRVRPLAAQAAPDDRGRHQRRARPPHDVRLQPRRGRHLPRFSRARHGRRRRARPDRAEREPRRVRAEPQLTAAGSTFEFDGVRRARSPSPARTTPATPPPR